MLYSFKIFPNWNTEGAGGGGANPPPTPEASPPPAAPTPSEPAPAAEPFVDETTAFALEAFEQLNSDDVEPPAEPVPAPSEPSPQPEATPPASTPATTPAAPVAPGIATPPVSSPAAPPTASPPAVQPPSPAAPPVPPVASPDVGQQVLSFEQIAEELAKQQEALITALADKQYNFSEKDMEDFHTNPGKLLARIAATVQVQTTASNMKVFAQQMPVMVQRLIQANRQNMEAENAFWNANPHLDRSKHRAVVADVMQKMRAINPEMDSQTFIREVGMYAGMKAGVGMQPQQPAATAASQVRTPGPVVRNTNGAGAFAPVGSNAAPASAHPAPPQNEWEKLFEIMRADESGAFET